MSNCEIIFEHLKTLAVADLVTYSTLSALVGHDVQRNRTSYYAAVRRLEKDCCRTMENVPGQGYVVAPASAHVRIGKRRVRSSERQMKLGGRVLRHVRRDELTRDERRELDALSQQVQNVTQAVTRLRRDSERHETLIQSLSQQTVDTSRQLETRLDHLEAMVQRFGLRETGAEERELVSV